MWLKIVRYDKEKNHHVATKESGMWCYVDFFVGCGIRVPVDPYDPVEYDRIAFGLVGKSVEIDPACWSEQHQTFLPEERHILNQKDS